MGFSCCGAPEVRLQGTLARTDISSVATDSFDGLLLAEERILCVLQFLTAGSEVLSQEFANVLRVLFAPVIGINAEFRGGSIFRLGGCR